MSTLPLRILFLASEWKSSKGGLSTMNREMAIQFAKNPNALVYYFVPKCSDKDKKAAKDHNVIIVEAEQLTGYKEPNDWLAFLPKDLVIDVVFGNSVVLGKQAQIIKKYHHCEWIHVVHTAPDELAAFKNYVGARSKGDEKQWDELELCEKADKVITFGPKLTEFYLGYFNAGEKIIFNFTPGTFTELFNLKRSALHGKKFRILVFGRGDCEDFELKGFDIAAQAVAALKDKSYHLIFVGAPSGSEEQVAEKFLVLGLNQNQLTVKPYVKNRENIKKLLRASNLALIPSRTEGFGLTALEALSAGLPFLVSQNSGFAEALQAICVRSSFILDSEDPKQWAEAIECVRRRGSEAIQECQELRTLYAEKYDWETQCNDFLRILFNGDDPSMKRRMFEYQTLSQTQLPEGPIEPVASSTLHTSSSETPTVRERIQRYLCVTQSHRRDAEAPGEDRVSYESFIGDQWAGSKQKSSSTTEGTKKQRGHDLNLKGQTFTYETPKKTLLQTAVTPSPVTEPLTSPGLHTSSPERRHSVRQRIDNINRGVYFSVENRAPHIRGQEARPKDCQVWSTKPVSPSRLHTSSSKGSSVRDRVQRINGRVYGTEQNGAPRIPQGARPKENKTLSKLQTTKQQRGHDFSMDGQMLKYQTTKELFSQTAETPPPVWSTELVLPSNLHTSGSSPEWRVQSINRGITGENRTPHVKDQGARPKEKSLSNTGKSKQQRDSFSLSSIKEQLVRRLKLRYRRTSQRRFRNVDMADMEPEKHLTQVAEEKLVSGSHSDGAMGCIDKEKSMLAENEVVMLITIVNYGRVSMEKNDIKFRYLDWTIPMWFLKKMKLERRTARIHNGQLIVISNEKGNLRYRVTKIPVTRQNKSNLRFLEEMLSQKTATPQPVKTTELAALSRLEISSPERPTVRERDHCIATNLEGPKENTAPHIYSSVQWTSRRPRTRLKKRSSSRAETTKQQKGYDTRTKIQTFQYQPPNQTLKQTAVTPLPVRVAEQATTSRFHTSLSSERPTAREIGLTLELPEENRTRYIRHRRAKPLEKSSSNTEATEEIKVEISQILSHSVGYDPSKKRQTFHYQPPNQMPQQTAVTPLPVRLAEQATSSGFHTFSSSERPTAGEKGPILEVPEENRAQDIRDQRAKPLEKCSSITETTEEIKDLEILGCNASMDSMYAVTRTFENIRPRPNHNANHPVKNLSPSQVKQYLEDNSLRSCFLVMDAEIVKDAYENKKNDYEDLFNTLVDRVDEKVIICVCDSPSLSPEDQAIIYQNIDRNLRGRDKGFVAWLKDGKLIVNLEDLADILTSLSLMAPTIPQTSHAQDIQGQTTSVATTESAQSFKDLTSEYHVIEPSGLGLEKQHFQKPQCTRKIHSEGIRDQTTFAKFFKFFRSFRA